ncbi:DEAD/DEAH box helicase family protein [Sulfitobacter brevis]|uniref:DEAD/DEAH box helicase family protein n=1 Tax=Sulfitobacter brevis TaxID=74348 RepID=UPI001C42F630|nr:DEAD/DEAH box helicase family protein [Sulfitobacter brevis]
MNRWMLSHFEGGSLSALKGRLGDIFHEDIRAEGQTGFFNQLEHMLVDPDQVSAADLRRYDLHIVTHWQAITKKRNRTAGAVLTMKYFQYLSLLFSEIYLDWYFNRRQALLDGLNVAMSAYHEEKGAEPFRNYTADDLNKLAFWNATGSGKTLLLHVNIKQYLHYYQAEAANSYPDRIILLTPNEGLSVQHVEEFRESGISAQLFDKNETSGMYRGRVDVIDVNKLADDTGEKTVAVSAFAGDNLVLVDEGHRGTGSAGGAWMARRAALVEGGFAFEYSATFSQSVAKGKTILKAEVDVLNAKAKLQFGKTYRQLTEAEQAEIVLTSDDRARAKIAAVREAYAKAVLIDYSYKYFYADGYGKDSLILNLREDAYNENGDLYFTACLLSYYQQLWLWETKKKEISAFNIAKPLWVFVGNTVTGEDSDVLEVLRFLARFLGDEAGSVQRIRSLVEGNAQLLDPKGQDIFEKRFVPLMHRNSEDIYKDILKRLFNAEARQRLKLVNLKATDGELAVRVGTSEPFALINIGNAAGFFKTAADETTFETESDDFGGGFFGAINSNTSPLNILIGSRKFTEGWSSWRVSTMGLLNMGAGEGSQIVQLFGRGVRLKGQGMSLKRSLPDERPKSAFIEKLETLNIFGVRANYMASFKDYLREEGVTPSDEILHLDFPTQKNLPKGLKLKSLKLRDGFDENGTVGFKRKHFPSLYEIPQALAGKIKQPHVTVDLYPRLEALDTTFREGATAPSARNSGKLCKDAFSFFDWFAIFEALARHKDLRGYSNLRLSKDQIKSFCEGDNEWYTLIAPDLVLSINSFENVRALQAILIRLLCEFTDRFYAAIKAGFEGEFYDAIVVEENHPAILEKYALEFEGSDEARMYHDKIVALSNFVASKDIAAAAGWAAKGVVAISFEKHLYYPLLTKEKGSNIPLELRPMAFDAPSEIRFVRDLEEFCKSRKGVTILDGKRLFLLRNPSVQSKGLGFATAGNFYPDFLLWVVDDSTGQQWLTLVDPKGIRQLSISDAKFNLFKEIRSLESGLEDRSLVLNAFILSDTPYPNLLNIQYQTSKLELEEKHVLFMDDGQQNYLSGMFSRILASE